MSDLVKKLRGHTHHPDRDPKLRCFKCEAADRIEELEAHMIHVYNSGYHAGHHHTVEGGYTDIYPCDMDTYHTEEVQELLEDLKGEKV